MTAKTDTRLLSGVDFHRHLDVCERCRNRPMDLCPRGADLLRKAVMT